MSRNKIQDLDLFPIAFLNCEKPYFRIETTYRRDGESVGRWQNFFLCLLLWPLLTGCRQDVSAGISNCDVGREFQ
ncbi:hypothetical protein TRIP_B100002 [uncultured Desulfatiglans sp.]|nr:hypothetical protein TRIP_B100002 [uncultured Desulfatiglans sp.]